MTAVIQAGGRGSRVSALTNNIIPKPLLSVGGTPIIERQISTLAREGISDFIIIVGHLGSKIQEYLDSRSRFGVNIQYFEETQPLGSGGSVVSVAEWVDDDFLLVNGDLVFDFDLKRFVDYHHAKNSRATLFVHPSSHPHDSDLVVADTYGRVNKFYFKGSPRNYWYGNLTNAGVFILNPFILRRFPQNIPLSLEHDVLAQLITDDIPVCAYRSSEYVRDAGTPERILQCERDIELNIPARRNLRTPQKAVFLDRDGTINRDSGLIYKPEQFELLPHSAAAIRLLNESGYLVLCVTNQSVVARGLCGEETVQEIHRKMQTLLGQSGAYLDDIAYCPHHPDGGYPEERPEYKIHCECRKPGIAMITRLAEQHNIELAQSWLIGDSDIDMQCGQNSGMSTIRVTHDFSLLDAVNRLFIKEK